MRPLRSRVLSFSLLLAAGAFGVSACRSASRGGASEGAEPVSVDSGRPAATAEAGAVSEDSDGEAEGDAESEPSAWVNDGGQRFRRDGPQVDVDLEGSPDPACTGAELAFASVVIDPRCGIRAARAKKLRALLDRDGGAVTLRQEAKVLEDGRVALRLVNTGGRPLTLPLSFHGKLPAFSVLAEDEHHSLFELAPPPLELRDPGQGDRSHVARIVLPPAGAAQATIAILPLIVRVLGRGAGDGCRGVDAGGVDGARCNPVRLPRGRYVLHVGELLTDVEAGPPARVTWDAP